MGNQFHRWFLALLAWPLLPLCGMACDCPYHGAPCKAFANTPTVFVGRVVKVSTIDRKTASGDEYKDRLVFAKTAEVVTGWGGGDCGYEFHEGVEYLVYGYTHREKGRLYTGICQRTRLLSEAAEDLEYLSKKNDPSHGARIEGTIEELDSKNRIQVVGFLGGIQVLVEGPSGRQTIVSQKDGRFQLWGLSPGSYRVTPALPKSFLPDEQTVKLERASCAELRFLATPPPQGERTSYRP